MEHDFYFLPVEELENLIQLVFLFDANELEIYAKNHGVPMSQIEMAKKFHPLLESYLDDAYTDQAENCAWLPHHTNYPGFDNE